MSEFPCQPLGLGGAFVGAICDNGRAQNGPGIAELELRPGPDLSASLTTVEEH